MQESIVSTHQGNSAVDPKPSASGSNHQNIGRACIAQDLIYFLIKGVDLNLVRARHLTQQSICFATAIKENLLETLVFQHTCPLSSMSRPNATAIPSKGFPIERQVYTPTSRAKSVCVEKGAYLSKNRGKPYPLSHEVGKRGGSHFAELKYARKNQWKKQNKGPGKGARRNN